MNKLLGIFVLIIIIGAGIYWYASSSQAPASPATPMPTTTTSAAAISFPKGGETLIPGQPYTLAWDIEANKATSTPIFLIDTSLESAGASVAISDRVYGLPNTGTYEYTVPANIKPGVYKFEIGTLMSNPFQIASSTQ